MSSNATSTKNTACGQPNTTSGQYHSVKGTAVEAIGDLAGANSWQQSGKQADAEGEAGYQAAQAKGYVEGTVDRMTGKKDSIVGAVVGDRTQEIQGNMQHDEGKAQQDLSKPAY
ncbi:hypothetical protein DXG03_004798 [Asterophora parasitica]|uniref:CsbD-like domain-containing protein n=1 Tax=Asterophora parasitica TaxID=117018 RepID=A0A9P7G2E1_9AGAR|nr:hypothetical protein DXG03_004798 [Asterophora parasitica]